MKKRYPDRRKPGLQRIRRGFTLIELMVAAALSLVIMTIIAMAFQSAMGTLSTLKAMGDQADRLRTAEVMLRADLEGDHIVLDDGGSTIKVSDLRFDQGTPTFKGGYFALLPNSQSEGIDSDSISSTRMGGIANQITMTVKRSSRTPSDLFGITRTNQVTDTLTGVDGTQWAEVKWTLNPNPKLSFPGTTMYSLHRVVMPLSGGPPKQPNATLNSNTFTPDPNGNDIVLTNVLSFEVKPLIANQNGTLVQGSLDPPYSDVYWNSYGGVPSGMAANNAPNRCVAVLVKVRVYDIKTKLTRQMSLIVKL